MTTFGGMIGDPYRAMNEARSLPQDALRKEMRSPSGIIPPVIAASELQTRQAMRGGIGSIGFAGGGLMSIAMNPMLAKINTVKDPEQYGAILQEFYNYSQNNQPKPMAPLAPSVPGGPEHTETLKPQHGGNPRRPTKFMASGGYLTPQEQQARMQLIYDQINRSRQTVQASGISDPEIMAQNLANESNPAVWTMNRLIQDYQLTPYQAAGAVGNFGHETGGFKYIQEIEPVVPGSRGGLGWAQWTGPRRRAFEGWMAEQGFTDPWSNQANYGFMQHELATDHSSALDALRNAKDLRGAVYGFEQTYERAGHKNYPSRMKHAQQALDAYNASLQGGVPVAAAAPATKAPVAQSVPANPAAPVAAPMAGVEMAANHAANMALPMVEAQMAANSAASAAAAVPRVASSGSPLGGLASLAMMMMAPPAQPQNTEVHQQVPAKVKYAGMQPQEVEDMTRLLSHTPNWKYRG